MIPVPHPQPTYEQLLQENEALRWRVEEAEMTLEAIRTGSVDALVVQGQSGHELYTLTTADAGYRVFIESMNEGAVTLSEDGIILYCNRAFAALAGRSTDSLFGQSLESIIEPAHKSRYQMFFLSTEEAEGKIEMRITGAARPVPCQFSVTPFRLEAERVYSVIVTDLTAQKEAQAELKEKARALLGTNLALERSNHDLMQFASVASHDLQEPLRKMTVFGGMARNMALKSGQPQVSELIDKLLLSATRMRRLVADILNYSRLSVDGLPLGAVDLNEVLAEVIDDYELLIADKNARVTVTGDLPLFTADRGQMQQVFHNLLGNALKFAHPERPLHIRIEAGKDGQTGDYRIGISDNGIGFEPQYKERIFSLFQRLNTKDQYEGSGIGLSVVRRILEKHQGAIHADGRAGEGAAFTIFLPGDAGTTAGLMR